MADTPKTDECALTVVGYLDSEQDNSLQGEFANIMSYLAILKKTAKNLARKFHPCSFCEKNEFTWLTAKGRRGNVESLIPVCVCKAAEVETESRHSEAHEDEDSSDIEIQNNHDDAFEEIEEAEPTGTTSEIKTESTEQQEKLNNLQEALTLVHTGVKASTAARQTGVSANELKAYMKQVDSKRSKRKQQEQVKCSWTEEDLDEALRLIREEKMSPPQAAKRKGIPYTTLWHKLQDRKTGGILRYKCSYCPLVYRRKYVRNMHEKVKHKNEYPYLCTHCGKGFTYEKRMEQHIKTHHLMITNPPKMKKCPKCDQKFSLVKDLNTHLREHSDMPYICSQCGDGFQTPKEYSEHSVAVHRAHFKNQSALCDKKYNYKHLLAEHIKKVHTGERPFPCPQCPLRFPSVRLKNAHVKRSHGAPEERYKPCSYCGKMMANQALEKHIRSIHQGLKLYTCHHCNTKFNCLQNLNRHIRTHTGEKPYICTQCGKTFAQSNACKQHYNTHHPGLEYKAKRIDKPEKIPTALLEDIAVSSEVMDATSAFQETDLTALLNIQHALDAGTDLLSS